MKFQTLICAWVLASGSLFSIDALCPPHTAEACIVAALQCRYEEALSISESAARADSTDPLPSLLRLTVLGIRDVDFDTVVDSAEFFRTFFRTEALISASESANGASSHSLMLSGLCKGIYASFLLRHGSYYSALKTGFGALDLLNESYGKDSANTDALFLPGLYDYAKGEMKTKLWWMLFWYPGSKERGITRLERCSRHGAMTAHASRFVLADVYRREKKLSQCGTFLTLLEQEYPQSRFTLWQKIRYLEARRQFYEASLACERLAESYTATRYGGYSALLVRGMQADFLVRSGQKKDARRVCREILTTPASRRNKVILNEAEKLLRSIDVR